MIFSFAHFPNFNVSNLYKSPGTFKGGTIQGVGVTVSGKTYLKAEAEAKRLMMAQ